jgi:hypothetical protein
MYPIPAQQNTQVQDAPHPPYYTILEVALSG